MRPKLIVMVKEPRAGRVKTRLGRDIGMSQAAWWFRHQAARTLRRLRDPRWDLAVAVSPDREGLSSAVWPSDLPRLPQGRGDLGARMARAFTACSPAPTCIIGADIPAIEKHHIREAFAKLGSHSACVGPAEDGGYWLIGLAKGCHPPRGFLQDVRWSSAHALADTLKSADRLTWAELETLSDVDTVDDLRRLMTRA